MPIAERDPLVEFLYVLMRDEATPGRVYGIIDRHVRKTDGMAVTYSNPHLAAMAAEIADELRRLPSHDQEQP